MAEIQHQATSRITLEVCVASVADALAAQAGGADRLELNATLALGGLTPSWGLLHEVRQAVNLPLLVMIRPRAGGFCYSDREFVVMQRDVESALEQGADGLVFGILQPDGALDEARCAQLVALAQGREAVFHKAFDFIVEPGAALLRLAELGICRVMTSGGTDTALAGASQIARLVQQAAGKIEILPAGRIVAANVAELIARTGCRQVHAALRTLKSDPYVQLTPGAAPSHLETYEATCTRAVRDLRIALNACQAMDSPGEASERHGASRRWPDR